MADANVTESGLTLEDLERFKDTAIYQVFMATVGLRINALRGMLSSKSTTATIEDVRFLQGELSGAEFWATFVDSLLRNIENEQRAGT